MWCFLYPAIGTSEKSVNILIRHALLQITMTVTTKGCCVRTDIVLLFWLWAQPLTTESSLQAPKTNILKKNSLSGYSLWLNIMVILRPSMKTKGQRENLRSFIKHRHQCVRLKPNEGKSKALTGWEEGSRAKSWCLVSVIGIKQLLCSGASGSCCCAELRSSWLRAEVTQVSSKTAKLWKEQLARHQSPSPKSSCVVNKMSRCVKHSFSFCLEPTEVLKARWGKAPSTSFHFTFQLTGSCSLISVFPFPCFDKI